MGGGTAAATSPAHVLTLPFSSLSLPALPALAPSRPLSDARDPTDLALLCEAVREQRPVLEGYRVIIDSIAGIAP
jgi:hypothetical protein